MKFLQYILKSSKNQRALPMFCGMFLHHDRKHFWLISFHLHCNSKNKFINISSLQEEFHLKVLQTAFCFLLLNILNRFCLLVLNFTWKHFWESWTKTTFSKLCSDQNKTKNMKYIQNNQTIIKIETKSTLEMRQHFNSDSS